MKQYNRTLRMRLRRSWAGSLIDVCRSDRASTLKLAKNLYQASAIERVKLIRKGIPASRVEDIKDALHVSRERLVDILDLPRQKPRGGAMLSAGQSERLIGLTCLIGQIVVIVSDSGDPNRFDAARWVGEWLERPVPALGGAKPADFMGTMKGQTLVSGLLVQSVAGVFA